MPPITKRHRSVSLNPETIETARALAEQIEPVVGTEEAYQRALRSALDLMRQGLRLGKGPLLSRDEAHQR